MEERERTINIKPRQELQKGANEMKRRLLRRLKRSGS
jgi:hypothetical protein